MNKQVVVADGTLKAGLQAIGFKLTMPKKAQWPTTKLKRTAGRLIAVTKETPCENDFTA